jgi:hypothetical protein
MIPLDDVLEDLELPRAEPGIGYLERLFLRFNERVPFETASKIVRARRISEKSEGPRTPEIFWDERLQSGTGGTCFARVAAFHALVEALGFPARRTLGRVQEDFDHASLLVCAGQGEWICDVGFPLPALLPASDGRAESALGPLEVSTTARGFRIDLRGGVPGGPRGIEIFASPVTDAEYRERWEDTFLPAARFLSEVILQRLLENRRLTFARGSLRVEDLHSRALLPLAPPRAAALEELFGIDAVLLEDAFATAGDPEPSSPDASIEVFLESSLSAERAFSAIASPEGYARLFSGVAEVSTEPGGERSFRAHLSPHGAATGGGSIEEEVEIAPSGESMTVRRGPRVSVWSAENRDGTTWLS